LFGPPSASPALSRQGLISDLNQCGPKDSKLSLDQVGAIDDSVAMIHQPYHLYTERTDPARNMARYYAMEISETLFGEPCLTRRWGRIGATGQSLTHHFEREDEAVKLFLDLMRQKKARGYRPKCSLRDN
jgi:predicted DNA-binding WGR domain protein